MKKTSWITWQINSNFTRFFSYIHKIFVFIDFSNVFCFFIIYYQHPFSLCILDTLTHFFGRYTRRNFAQNNWELSFSQIQTLGVGRQKNSWPNSMKLNIVSSYEYMNILSKFHEDPIRIFVRISKKHFCTPKLFMMS